MTRIARSVTRTASIRRPRRINGYSNNNFQFGGRVASACFKIVICECQPSNCSFRFVGCASIALNANRSLMRSIVWDRKVLMVPDHQALVPVTDRSVVGFVAISMEPFCRLAPFIATPGCILREPPTPVSRAALHSSTQPRHHDGCGHPVGLQNRPSRCTRVCIPPPWRPGRRPCCGSRSGR